MSNSTKNMLRCLSVRFARGFFAAWVSSMPVFLQSGDLSKSALLSLVIGALSGGFMALDKFLRTEVWHEDYNMIEK